MSLCPRDGFVDAVVRTFGSSWPSCLLSSSRSSLSLLIVVIVVDVVSVGVTAVMMVIVVVVPVVVVILVGVVSALPLGLARKLRLAARILLHKLGRVGQGDAPHSTARGADASVGVQGWLSPW